MTWRRLVGWAGRSLLALAVLVLAFLGYELWGTGIAESRSQAALRSQLAQRIHQPPAATPAPNTPNGSGIAAPTASAGTVASPAPEGGPEGVIKIPKVGVDQVFIEGTATGDLRRGPGHYSGTPLPGQPGNAALAGHRTTYGEPFYNLNELRPGDQIMVSTASGTYRYDVSRSFVVVPSDVAVIAPTRTNQLTLTTCTPRFSASRRLIIQASLLGSPAPASPVAERSDVGASHVTSARAWLPVATWGLAAVAVALVAWLVARRRRRAWPVYLLFAPAFLAVLLMAFAATSDLLPQMA